MAHCFIHHLFDQYPANIDYQPTPKARTANIKMFCIIPIDKDCRNQSTKLDTYVPNTDLLGKSLRT